MAFGFFHHQEDEDADNEVCFVENDSLNRNDYAECEESGLLVSRRKAFRVKHENRYGHTYYKFYSKLYAPPYDSVETDGDGNKRYFRWTDEVDKDGNIYEIN